MSSELDEAELRQALHTAPLEVLGRFADASNATLLCRVRGVQIGGRELLAVYKPRAGERPLWDFPAGTLHRREVAAEVVDRALGWGMVPTTVLRDDAPHGVGSVQRFVEHDPDHHYFTLLEQGDPDVLAQLRRMVAFDVITNNTDRKGGHVLLDADRRLWLVDHGVCFHVEPKLRTVGWDLAGEAVPPSVRDDAARLADQLAGPSGAAARRLAELLAPEEVAATVARAGALASMETFPSPSGPRPWPWPPI